MLGPMHPGSFQNIGSLKETLSVSSTEAERSSSDDDDSDAHSTSSLSRRCYCDSHHEQVERCVFGLQPHYIFEKRLYYHRRRAVYLAHDRASPETAVVIRITTGKPHESTILAYLARAAVHGIEQPYAFHVSIGHTATVTRFVQGELSLPQSIANMGDFFELAISLMRSLTDIHGEGIIHRDIKMSNLIWTGRTCTVVDFELACAREGKARQIGTEGFMAPELLRPGPAYGPEIDVFSAGVTLWAILTQTREGRVDAPYVLPSSAFGSDAIIALLDRMLATDPDKRPSSAQCLYELATEYDRLRSQNPSAAQPPPPDSSSDEEELDLSGDDTE